MLLYAFRLEVLNQQEKSHNPLGRSEQLSHTSSYVVIQQVVEGIGSLEDGETFVKVYQKLRLNFFETLFLEIEDIKEFIELFGVEHLILL